MPQDYGIKISQDGIEVLSAEDIDLILKTDFTLLKVKQSGTISMAPGEVDITHDLGYVPQFLVFGKLNSSGFDPGAILGAVSQYIGFDVYGIAAGADTTKLTIASDGFFTSAYYFIFYEAA